MVNIVPSSVDIAYDLYIKKKNSPLRRAARWGISSARRRDLDTCVNRIVTLTRHNRHTYQTHMKRSNHLDQQRRQMRLVRDMLVAARPLTRALTSR